MTTDARPPTSDEAVSGTWSGAPGSRYTLVDDYPDTTPADVSVGVRYHDREALLLINAVTARIRVGGLYFNAATHDPSTSLVERFNSFPTNPKTASAWTPDDINGVGANALEAFGFFVSTLVSSCDFSDAQLEVTYSPPLACALTKTEQGDSLSFSANSNLELALAATEQGDALVFLVDIDRECALSVTEGGDALVSSAVAGARVASLGAVEAADSVSSAAMTTLLATVSQTEQGDTISSTLNNRISVALAIVEGGDTIIATFERTSIAAGLSVSEESDAISCEVFGAIRATASITEAGDMLAASAYSGVFEDDDTVLASASVDVFASLDVTEDDDFSATPRAGDDGRMVSPMTRSNVRSMVVPLM